VEGVMYFEGSVFFIWLLFLISELCYWTYLFWSFVNGHFIPKSSWARVDQMLIRFFEFWPWLARFEYMRGRTAVCMHRDEGWSYWSHHQGTATISGYRALPFHSCIYYKLKKISPVQLATGKFLERKQCEENVTLQELECLQVSWFESLDFQDLRSDMFECLRTCTWLNVHCNIVAVCAIIGLFSLALAYLQQTKPASSSVLFRFTTGCISVCISYMCGVSTACACVVFVLRSNKSNINQMGIHLIVYSVAS